jgi:hypothetical protein
MHPVQPIANAPQFAPVVPFDRNQVIKRIALQTLAELALSLAVGMIVCAFVVTPMGISWVIGAAWIQCVVTLSARILGCLAFEKYLENGPQAKKYLKAAIFCSHIAPISFAIGTALNAQTLIHESGHALAAKILYQGANPEITLFPFKGGVTHFFPEKLSALGAKLGKNKSIAWVTAAGPLASLAVSSAALATSLLIKDNHPKISNYLATSAIYDFIIHATYACSALFTSPTELSHDFVRLSHFGIHPLAATVAIIALPILITLGVKATQSHQGAAPLAPAIA